MREIGIALVALGALGVVAVIVAFIVIGGIFSRLQVVSEAAAGPLRSTARTISDAADAFDRFGDSLTEAQRSAASASDLAHQTSETLHALADTMSIQIFGTQPLLPAADGFRNSGDQLAGLGDDLGSMSEALGANVDDLEQASRNLRSVRSDMNTLLAAFQTDEGSDDGIGLARLGLNVLLAWLLLAALGCLSLGVLLVRR